MAALADVLDGVKMALDELTTSENESPRGVEVWGHDADDVVRERHWYLWPKGEDSEVGASIGDEVGIGRFREVNVIVCTYAVADTTKGSQKLRGEASRMLQAAQDHFVRTRNAGSGNVVSSIQIVAQGGTMDLGGGLWAASQLELTITSWPSMRG